MRREGVMIRRMDFPMRRQKRGGEREEEDRKEGRRDGGTEGRRNGGREGGKEGLTEHARDQRAKCEHHINQGEDRAIRQQSVSRQIQLHQVVLFSVLHVLRQGGKEERKGGGRDGGRDGSVPRESSRSRADTSSPSPNNPTFLPRSFASSPPPSLTSLISSQRTMTA